MSRLFIEGFEGGNTGCWDGFYSHVNRMSVVHKNDDMWDTYGFTKPRVGNYALFNNQSSTSYLTISSSLPENPQEIYIKFRYQIAYVASSEDYPFLTLYGYPNLNRELGQIGKTSTNMLYYLPSRTTEPIIITSFSMQPNTWMHIEFYGMFATSTTGGKISFRFNGILFQKANIDTNAEHSLDIHLGAIKLHNGHATERSIFDDFVLENSAFPGDGYITATTLATVNTPLAWTDFENTNWVDAISGLGELATIDNTYIYESDEDKEQTYLINPIADVEQVYSIQVCFRHKREGLPIASHIQPFIKRHSTSVEFNYGTSKISPIESFATGFQVWNTNPFSSSEWVRNDVNSLGIGVKTKGGV